MMSSYTFHTVEHCTLTAILIFSPCCVTVSPSQLVLPAVTAAVLFCDSVLIVPPDVDRRKDECNQHGEAAEQRKDGNALLLVL